MRALVVGLGSIGRRHARNWVSLGLGQVSVCRLTRTLQPEPLGIDAYQHDDLDAALGERPDVVLVTNPTSLHVQTACTALKAGAHVLVEKPLGHALEGVPELLDVANVHKRVLMVGYNLRFHPGLVRFRELLKKGAIGRPLSARAEMGEYLPGWHPWEDYRASYAGRRDLGGGPVLTFSHELDALCWILGRPVKITALAARTSTLEIETEDVAEIALQFAGGPLASVHVDYVRQAPRRTIEVIGEDGILRWEYDAHRLLQYAPATREWRVEEGDPRFTRNDMYLAELAHFAACARGEIARPLIDGAQGAAVLAISLAALRASDEGQAIELEHLAEPAATWLKSLERQ